MAGEAAKSQRRLNIIYGEVDVAIARQERVIAKEGKPVSCGEGCDACCHLLVTCTIPEALAMVQRLRMTGKLTRFKEAKRWEAAEAVLHEAGMTSLKYMEHRLPCPMLDVEAKRCTVYAERPATCRAWGVVTPAELCWEPGAEVSHPDRRQEREAMMLVAVDLCDKLNLPRVMLPLPVAIKWALIVHERGPEALREALSQTAFVTDEAILFYWARLELPDGRTFEAGAEPGSIHCRVCGTTTAQQAGGAAFCDSCGLFHEGAA